MSSQIPISSKLSVEKNNLNFMRHNRCEKHNKKIIYILEKN